ncbi:MAG: transporter substrate-binding domain-containing protein [Pseudomonadota bacterium]
MNKPLFFLAILIPVVACLLVGHTVSSHAQVLNPSQSAQQQSQGAGLSGLRFINPRSRIALPEPMPGPVLRFVIADDFPPFAFIDGEGRLVGLHVDLVRRLCDVLELACTVQARRFDQVLSAVETDPVNLVLVAGLSVSEELAQSISFSLPYFRFAGRFASLRAANTNSIADGWVERAQIGVIEGTAHNAFLQSAYRRANITSFPTATAMFQALRRGDVSHVFGDGADLAFWLAGSRSGDCCQFVGEPLFSNRYFGEGLTMAVPRGQPELIQAINAGLARLENSGELETIILTAFPLDPLGLN